MLQNHAEHLDESVLAQLEQLQRPGSPDLVVRVVGIYLQDAPRLIEGMRRSVAEADREALRRNAHSLKSSSGNVGGRRLARLAREMEERAREGSLDGANGLLHAIEAHLFALKQALEKRLEGRSAT